MSTSRIQLCRPRVSLTSSVPVNMHIPHAVIVPRHVPTMLRAPVFHTVKRHMVSHFVTTSLDDVPIPENDKLPLPPCDKDMINTHYAQQFRNPYKGNVNIPFVYTAKQQRENVTRRVNSKNNHILEVLREKIQAAEEKNERFVLRVIPSTPNYSLQSDLLYGTDSDDYLLPKALQDPIVDGKYTLSILTQTDRQEVMEAERKQELYKGFFGQKESSEAVHNAARDAAERAILFIRQRMNMPELYSAFNLTQMHYTTISMYELHAYFYIRSMKVRNTVFGEYFGHYLLGHLDQLCREECKRTKMKTSQIEKYLRSRLPGIRANMVIYDKALEHFVAGDCEPLYGLMYRNMFRFNEEEKYSGEASLADKMLKKEYLGTQFDVYMDKPIDMAYMNNMIQYIVNELYNNATCSIRDFHAHVSGLTDFIPIPAPPATLVGPLTKDEMLRFAYPIYNNRQVGPGLMTKLFRAVLNKPIAPELLFEQTMPYAHRPPTFIYSRLDQEKGVKPF